MNALPKTFRLGLAEHLVVDPSPLDPAKPGAIKDPAALDLDPIEAAAAGLRLHRVMTHPGSVTDEARDALHHAVITLLAGDLASIDVSGRIDADKVTAGRRILDESRKALKEAALTWRSGGPHGRQGPDLMIIAKSLKSLPRSDRSRLEDPRTLV